MVYSSSLRDSFLTAQMCFNRGLWSAPRRMVYPCLASSYDGLSQPSLPVYLVTLVSPPSCLVNLDQPVFGLPWQRYLCQLMSPYGSPTLTRV